MTIDERLDRLTERHEALTQSVEILTQRTQQLTDDVAAHEREMQRFRRAMRAALEAWLGEDGDEA